ncbi:KorA family transcriptional regulator [Paraburkholderia humisilvae]|uniref:Uncharacterized protein n=1 Tax=Paraburkholderia humisilvae TaxID=627669 RepID=A0A6J5FDQ0_9BURK|nr:KorA family transcriptional regulator [Paraburkholderia humisilvae]CAB3775315.1 hypothetical protein LMG29542_08697 [Paraburkholderia humisilvae]
MRKQKVYLALQSQLESFLHDRNVARAVIHRVGKRDWLPLIDARTETGEIHTFSIRLKNSFEPRTWSDVRPLVEWIDMRLGLDECSLSLSSLEWESQTFATEQFAQPQRARRSRARPSPARRR